jgi:hypothetical protein
MDGGLALERCRKQRYDETVVNGRVVVGLVAVGVFGLGVGCNILGPPDISIRDAAKLISRAPEFNRYARLIGVGRVDHLKDSMDSVSYGYFTFVQTGPPAAAAAPRKGWADFRYWDREWHLVEFDYGCDHEALDSDARLGECHSVQCYNPPPRH